MRLNICSKHHLLALVWLSPVFLFAQPSADNAKATIAPDLLQQPLPSLNQSERAQFSRGRGLFNQVWMASPSLDEEHDGLGPVFNQPSCSACHLRNGRGQPPASENERMRGALVRISVPAGNATDEPVPHPSYGDQLNDNAVTGIAAEGRAVVRWIEHIEYFDDGEAITLRRPEVTFINLAYGPPGDGLMSSLRVAPQIIGAGLLDAVPDSAIAALAAESRVDGISGRANIIVDSSSGKTAIGKFGWKANAVSLTQQTAAAFNGDLGITSRLHPEENCPGAEEFCARLEASVDLSDAQLEDVVFYQATLALPAARNPADPVVLRGKELFERAGCQHCHVPALTSGNNALAPALANTTFNAYTDLLLHDMGEGLADGRPDHSAGPTEWKTAPLWGIGLIPAVNEHQTLLHDGRARGVLEAIMWHGGEAAPARARVQALPEPDRDALVVFVNSL